MTDKEQIEELAKELFNIKTQVYSPFTSKYDGKDKFFAIAEELYSAGYRKTIWHKVVEGDLPKRSNKDIHAVPVQAYYEDSNGLKSNGPLYYFFLDNSFHTLGNPRVVKVIAWTELPEYKE